MTSKQLSSPCRRKPRGKAKPSIELASVYLELKSRVEPTWDNPEPDDYIVGLDGDVMVSGSGEEDDVRVGYINAFNVHLDRHMTTEFPGLMFWMHAAQTWLSMRI